MSNVPLRVSPIVFKETVTIIDANAIWEKWRKIQSADKLGIFANKIGVEPMSLLILGCVWAEEHAAWAFPMRDAANNIVGIRLRNEQGEKWAVRGSKQGLFIPRLEFQKRLYVVEGPTDTAAALSLELSVIGRPSCKGCELEIAKFIKSKRIAEVVIVADNDKPGIEGAERLKSEITGAKKCIAILPCKDIREFLNHGGNKDQLESIIKNLVWR